MIISNSRIFPTGGRFALFAALALALGGAACSDDGDPDPDVHDSGVEASVDVGGDVGADVGVDATADQPQTDGPLPGGSHLWSLRLGHAGAVEEMVSATDSSGNVYVTGAFRGMVNLGGSDLTSAGQTDIFVASFTAAGGHRWSAGYGGSGVDKGYAITVSGDGAVAVAGAFEDAVDFGGVELTSAGSNDAFVASYEGNGAFRWAKRVGGSQIDEARAVAVDSNGYVTLAGRFQGTVTVGATALTAGGGQDILLVSYEADGSLRWAKGVGGAESAVARGIAVDGSGNLTITGYFDGSVDFGDGEVASAGFDDVFVASYDESGAHRWTQTFGGASADLGIGVVVDGGGNATVTGRFEGTIDCGGGALVADDIDVFVASYTSDGSYRWSAGRGGTSHDEPGGIAVDGSGNVAIAGRFLGTTDLGGGALSSAGQFDVFVASYDASGAHLWSKGLGGGGYDEAFGVALDSGGNALVTGSFQGAVDLGGGALQAIGDTDVFAARFGVNGTHQWDKGFSGNGGEEGLAVAVDGSGNAAVLGAFRGVLELGGAALTCGGGRDLFVASYDGAGSHRWSRRIGGEGYEEGGGVAADASGNVFVVGTFEGAVEIEGPALTSSGGTDVFVVSYDQAGVHRWTKRLGGSGYDKGFGVAVGGSGDVVVVGTFDTTIDLGGGDLDPAGGDDLFVVGLAGADGAHRWSVRGGGTSSEDVRGVAVDGGGNAVVVGFFEDTAGFGGSVLTSAGSDDVFIVSYAGADGAHRWSRRGGGSGADEAHGVAVDGSGDVTVAGSFEETASFGGGDLTSAGAFDAFVAHFSGADGGHLWSKRFGGPDDDHAMAIAYDDGGNIHVTGSFAGTADLGGGDLTSVDGSAAFVASYDGSGAHRWSLSGGGPWDERGTGAAANGSAVLVSGTFDERIDLGGGPLVGQGCGFLAAFAR